MAISSWFEIKMPIKLIAGGEQEYELPLGDALHKGDGEDGELKTLCS